MDTAVIIFCAILTTVYYIVILGIVLNDDYQKRRSLMIDLIPFAGIFRGLCIGVLYLYDDAKTCYRRIE